MVLMLGFVSEWLSQKQTFVFDRSNHNASVVFFRWRFFATLGSWQSLLSTPLLSDRRNPRCKRVMAQSGQLILAIVVACLYHVSCSAGASFLWCVGKPAGRQCFDSWVGRASRLETPTHNGYSALVLNVEGEVWIAHATESLVVRSGR